MSISERAPGVLEVRGLRAGYGRIPILTGVDFTVNAGEIVGILGHNGMGKSTLLRTLMGYIGATAGSVRFSGEDVTRLPTYQRSRRGLGFVPQGREIFPQLSVLDNLRMGGLDAKPGRVEEVLADFPRLKPMLDRPGGALSGGEQQILAIARSLCSQPRMMLFDEPTEGIQPSIVEQISALLHSLNRAHGLTIVVVEQNLDFIVSLASRVLIIQKGTIVREVTRDQLQSTDIVDEFVGLL